MLHEGSSFSTIEIWYIHRFLIPQSQRKAATVLKTLIKLPWVYMTKETAIKCRKGIKNIKQKNRAQNKLGFRYTSIESSSFCQYLYIVRRGGRKTERLSLEGGEGEETKFAWEIEGERKGKEQNLTQWIQKVEVTMVFNKREGNTETCNCDIQRVSIEKA